VKNNKIVLGIVVLCVGLLFFKKLLYKGSGARWTVGIVQTASHPALDAARQGLIDYVQEKMGRDVSFVVRNGEGSVNALYTIAQYMGARSDVDLVYAIATPAAQAVTSVIKEKPVIMAAVTVDLQKGSVLLQENVCIISDMINVHAEVAALHELLPQVKTVGVLFNTAEVNAVMMANLMMQELEKSGLAPYAVGVSSEADIEPAVRSAVRKVDALLAPTDNTVANTIALVSELVSQAKKPLIVSDNLLVTFGALMSRGVDYYESGRQAGMCAEQIVVHHKKPYETPVIMADTKEIFVNRLVSAELGVVVPKELEKDVVFVE